MNGSDYIAAFLSAQGVKRVYLMNGGACAFMIDSIARHKDLEYICVQHEQAAAMAADAVWRSTRSIGVTMATSGPGATNLLTGIACSFFDSIPTLHITGQVNMRESDSYEKVGASPRQAGFQETKIVEMARPITKYAVQVRSGEQLKDELAKAYGIALSGRMGPVLIDVPMDVQMAEVGDELVMPAEQKTPSSATIISETVNELDRFFAKAKRPLVLFGAGVGLANVEASVAAWLASSKLPFVASWNGSTYFDHDMPGYLGTIGVYGNRGANYVLQNCDALLVLGSRLDNRQRSGNATTFCPETRVHVVDIDTEELGKYRVEGYGVTCMDFQDLPNLLREVSIMPIEPEWADYTETNKAQYFGKDIDTFARNHNTLSPYQVVRKINNLIDDDAIVATDTGAAVCWIFQTFHRRRHEIFTAGGNSPMGYSLPAAIAAKLEAPERQVICFSGDGGFQLNIQELQTLKNHNLDIKIIILNNNGYGIIKQYQDSYLGSRYDASGIGYGAPDFGKVVQGYGLDYTRVETLEQLNEDAFASGARVLDVIFDENTLIEPKLEVGRPINDQFPYVTDEEFAAANRYVKFKRYKD
jgi:acetolactate synthase I/II/III large subunit